MLLRLKPLQHLYQRSLSYYLDPILHQPAVRPFTVHTVRSTGGGRLIPSLALFCEFLICLIAQNPDAFAARPGKEGMAGNGINDLVIRAGKFFGLLCEDPFGFAVINPSSGGV
jgi:hypothetical protein